MINLNTPIEKVPKIGPTYQKKLRNLKINTVRDLLFYFPSRYIDFSKVTPISQVKVGQVVCVEGKISKVNQKRTFSRWMSFTEITVGDRTGWIKALWFNQPYLAKNFKENDLVRLAGKVSLGKKGIFLANPAYEKVDNSSEEVNFIHTGRIVPVYKETRGLTSRWLRSLIKPLLYELVGKVDEVLPQDILKKYNLMPIKEAIWQIHFPDSEKMGKEAKQRFSFGELFLLELFVLKNRAEMSKKQSLTCLMDIGLIKEFTNSLPFKLTDSQRKCLFQILKDLERPIPMSRLLEGDVGSGKTVVAAAASLNVVKRGYQVAFMSPTEILVQQHFNNIVNLLKKFNVSMGLLTSKEAKIFREGDLFEVKKDGLLEDLKNGQIDIILGTHSLIQKGIDFKSLALVIVDEQHRFGVEQRSKLVKNKEFIPHLLSMTATPIPRTLALTIYGDLDLSLIKEMPKDRKKVKTLIVEPEKRKAAYEFIRKEVKKGNGVFVICPRIEVSNSEFIPASLNEVKAVKEEYEKLSKEIFPDLKVSMIHGKLKAKEKEKIMSDFKIGKSDILVSTSVVEVGVDVPRATIMIIEGSERFGLAQLHQFRGRVGRSDKQSYCLLFTTLPDQKERKRLKALVNSNSGFELAQKDLEIRGPGQIYGQEQWGIPDIAMQGIFNVFLVEKTRQAAKELLEKDPDINFYPSLKERLKQFELKIHFE